MSRALEYLDRPLMILMMGHGWHGTVIMCCLYLIPATYRFLLHIGSILAPVDDLLNRCVHKWDIFTHGNHSGVAIILLMSWKDEVCSKGIERAGLILVAINTLQVRYYFLFEIGMLQIMKQ